VRNRFDRYDSVALGFLSLVKALNPGTKPDGKVGRFHKGPGQILIAVFSVAAPFAFTVADLLTPHAPALRCKIAHRGKSPYVSGLQHDRERQDRSDPRNTF